MKNTLPVLVLVSVLLTAALPASAGGSSRSESLAKWCTNNGGISDKTTCTIEDTEVAVVAAGKVLLIPPGRTLIINGESSAKRARTAGQKLAKRSRAE